MGVEIVCMLKYDVNTYNSEAYKRWDSPNPNLIVRFIVF